MEEETKKDITKRDIETGEIDDEDIETGEIDDEMEMCCNVCLETSKPLYNLNELQIQHNNCSIKIHMKCFLKCFLKKTNCIVCHNNKIVISKLVIDYILNIISNEKLRIKCNSQQFNNMFINKLIQKHLLYILKNIEDVNKILDEDIKEFENEDFIDLNIFQIIESNNLDMIYDMLSNKFENIQFISTNTENFTEELQNIEQIENPSQVEIVEENIQQYIQQRRETVFLRNSASTVGIFNRQGRRERIRRRRERIIQKCMCSILKIIFEPKLIIIYFSIIFIVFMLFEFDMTMP